MQAIMGTYVLHEHTFPVKGEETAGGPRTGRNVRTLGIIALPLALLGLWAAHPARAQGQAKVAALQIALRAHGLYRGTIDGIPGAGTTEAVQKLQRRKRLVVDGIAGPRTRRALGRLGRPGLGTRPLVHGTVGWDVAALQFQLAWRGFPCGRMDGRFGERTEAAVRRFQRWSGLLPDGVAGISTLAALRGPLPHSPLLLAWPLSAPLGDDFGPRGAHFHAGIDLPADSGMPVAAARSGMVVYSGWRGAFGKLVAIAHGSGVRTLYAHLSRRNVVVGQWVTTGGIVGLVGSTGRSTGPHLHFEVRLRGAAVDPLSALAR